MVLAELGNRITAALRKMTSSTVLDEAVIDDMLKEICNALIASDVNFKIAMQLRNNIKNNITLEKLSEGADKRRIVRQTVFEEIKKMLDSGVQPYKPIKGKTNVIMFVGLQGSGKTTSITKMALYYKNRGFKPALVAADTFRAGAFEQLQQNARKVGVPCIRKEGCTNAVEVATDCVNQLKKEKYDLILVDTSGRHKQAEGLFEEMEGISNSIKPNQIVFVMDAAIGQSVFEQAQAFKKKVEVGAVIVTKLDGHAKGGGALSAVAATKSPIIFIGTGEKMNEFETFDPHSFVCKLLNLGDIKGLVNIAKDLSNTETTKKMYEHMKEGKFTLRDWKEQYSNIAKMGSMSNIIQMMGLGGNEKINGEEMNKKMKVFMVILDSLTNKELDGTINDLMNEPSRIVRIQRGSGRSKQEIDELFSQFKMMQQMLNRIPAAQRKKLLNMKGGMPDMNNLSNLDEAR